MRDIEIELTCEICGKTEVFDPFKSPDYEDYIKQQCDWFKQEHYDCGIDPMEIYR